MLLLGLTGSIATGKSTVSSLLRDPPYSLPIIDADVIARQVVEPGTMAYKKIVEAFGPSTPDLLLPDDPSVSQPSLNRAALGQRVFGDSPERKRDRAILNRIVHPAVRKEMYKQLLRSYLCGHWAVVLDVPLLFESGLDALCGVVMVVAVRDPVTQMRRLRERDRHLSEEDAKNRVSSQGDLLGKVRRCQARGRDRGVVVWNDHGKEELKREVEMVMNEVVRRGSPRWWAWLLLLCPPLAGLVALWTYWRNARADRRWKAEEAREKANL